MPSATSSASPRLVSELCGEAALLLRNLAIHLHSHPTILHRVQVLLLLLVVRPVQFPSAWVPRAVVGIFCWTHLWQTGCFSRSSSIPDGSLPQQTQARFSAAGALP